MGWWRSGLVSLFPLALLIVVGAAKSEDKAPAKEIRVLFVGNSQIFYNDLPKVLEALAASGAEDKPRIKTARAVFGGASLETHWNKGDGEGTARAQIATKKWDYVILQDIYYTKVESFDKHARLFHELINQHGAKTILYSTASINSMYPEGFKTLHEMHLALGKELKVPVAAAGQAWLSYWGESPSEEQRLDLYHTDKAHPGPKGSYLSACVLYAALTGGNPIGLTHQIPDWPAEALAVPQARRFQEAAWKVQREINGHETK